MPVNKPEPWKQLSSTLLLKHERMDIVEDEVELPNGKTSRYIYQKGTKEGGDAEEFISSEWVSIPGLRKMIADGEVVNFSILAGMSLYDAKNTTYNKNHSS
jgi:hypothetical protein